MSYQLINATVVDGLKELADNSLDGCFCDPPYGLRFMQKRWDYQVPSVSEWREVLRVLKPGAHILAFGGTRTSHRMVCNMEDAGAELRDCLMWIYGQGFPKSSNLGGGFGSALKPAYEPIELARKPIEGTLKANFAKWQTGGLRIDDCRVGTAGGTKGYDFQKNDTKWYCYGNGLNNKKTAPLNAGRFPANLILSDEAIDILDSQAPNCPGATGGGKHKADYQGGLFGTIDSTTSNYADQGSASRFFYCAKVSSKERGESNEHPTLKPIVLCTYLSRLILPPYANTTLLVPWCGTGSEMIGALKAGWSNVIGIEREQKYIETAKQRLNNNL